MDTKEKINWKVKGMDCATCALTINKYLTKEGGKDIRVNFATGDVSFENNANASIDKISKGLADLGYTVVDEHQSSHAHTNEQGKVKGAFIKNNAQRFWFCLPFTLILMLHMIPAMHHSWIMQPYIQLALCLPVYIVGMSFLV
ncbi:cation transporter [Niabella ginsengisoli]|uniref:HMA domain-containing protein n=1 Tax=Niabella ginsengisoli TaxID=522298 RepID=A0ABS9SEF7_9BACT|nr:cation transporter [Niabella ginsengisoli]MCH5596741.1 hypothetical protein [Niabella ginsengisoli]